jgi:hypothetical protein
MNFFAFSARRLQALNECAKLQSAAYASDRNDRRLLQDRPCKPPVVGHKSDDARPTTSWTDNYDPVFAPRRNLQSLGTHWEAVETPHAGGRPLTDEWLVRQLTDEVSAHTVVLERAARLAPVVSTDSFVTVQAEGDRQVQYRPAESVLRGSVPRRLEYRVPRAGGDLPVPDTALLRRAWAFSPTDRDKYVLSAHLAASDGVCTLRLTYHQREVDDDESVAEVRECVVSVRSSPDGTAPSCDEGWSDFAKRMGETWESVRIEDVKVPHNERYPATLERAVVVFRFMDTRDVVSLPLPPCYAPVFHVLRNPTTRDELMTEVAQVGGFCVHDGTSPLYENRRIPLRPMDANDRVRGVIKHARSWFLPESFQNRPHEFSELCESRMWQELVNRLPYDQKAPITGLDGLAVTAVLEKSTSTVHCKAFVTVLCDRSAVRPGPGAEERQTAVRAIKEATPIGDAVDVGGS